MHDVSSNTEAKSPSRNFSLSSWITLCIVESFVELVIDSFFKPMVVADLPSVVVVPFSIFPCTLNWPNSFRK
jgi:hypothetical protein